MRQIKVRKGRNKYKLIVDKDGLKIGEITVTYTPESKTCSIDITKLGKDMTWLSIANGRLM